MTADANGAKRKQKKLRVASDQSDMNDQVQRFTPRMSPAKMPTMNAPTGVLASSALKSLDCIQTSSMGVK